MNKLGFFLTGAVVGAAGLALTACLVEGFPSAESSYDNTDNDDGNNSHETNDSTDTADTVSLSKTTEEKETASAYRKTDTSSNKEMPCEGHRAAAANSTAETITKIAEVLTEIIKTIPKTTAANK